MVADEPLSAGVVGEQLFARHDEHPPALELLTGRGRGEILLKSSQHKVTRSVEVIEPFAARPGIVFATGFPSTL